MTTTNTSYLANTSLSPMKASVSSSSSCIIKVDHNAEQADLSAPTAKGPLVLQLVLHDLQKFTAELGPDHDRVGEAWSSLGLIRLHMQRDLPAAIECHQEALKIFRQSENPTKAINMGVTMADLAFCYERAHMVAEALQLYTEALEILTDLGSQHPTKPNIVVDSLHRSIARLSRS